MGHVGFSLDDVDDVDEVFPFSPLRESYSKSLGFTSSTSSTSSTPSIPSVSSPLLPTYEGILDFRQLWTPRRYYYYYYRMGGLTQEWRVIWKFSFWSIFTFKTLFSHSTVRRRAAWRARFQGSKAERARGARSVPSLSTLARTPPLPRERVWGFWCAPRRSEGPHEAKFPFNSLSNAIRSKISGSNRADKSENFPLGAAHSCLKSRILVAGLAS